MPAITKKRVRGKPPIKKIIRRAPVKPQLDPQVKTELEEQVVVLADKKHEAKLLSEEITLLQSKLIEAMDVADVTKISLDHNGERIVAAIVEAKREVIDEPKLKKALGALLWNKVTTRVLDRRKLDAFIKSGEVDANLVARSINLIPNAPYIRIDRK